MKSLLRSGWRPMRRRLRNIRKRRIWSACTTEDAAAVLAQVKGMMPAFNVFFEFARPGISFGQPPVMAFRLIDILYHTRLQDIGQVIECLEAINEAFARVRRRRIGQILRLRQSGPLPDRAGDAAQRCRAVAGHSGQPPRAREAGPTASAA